MRTLTLTLMMGILVGSAGCNDNQKYTATALTGQETDLTLRMGVVTENADLGSTELYATAKYLRSSEIPWGPEPDLVGAGIIFYPTFDIAIVDTPQPSPIKSIIEALHARPYVLLELVAPVDGHQRKVQPNWAVGTLFVLDPVPNLGIKVEYIDGDQVERDTLVGISGAWKF